jgi:flavin reductase (DIM6/NTAB) family NADH-FMN oxidoreductase RutF
MVEIHAVSSDPSDLRRLYGCFPSGVTAICTIIDGTPVGMAASAFTAVSLEPPLVAVCVQNSSTTWPKLRTADRLGVSVLAEHQHRECQTLAIKEGDRFAGVQWAAGADGAVFVQGAAAWLACSLHAELAAGDHAIALLEIHGFHANPSCAPLIFHASRFRQLAAIV